MSSNLKEKVKWYQAMLKKACGHHEVPVNGNHNDKATKAAMRTYQTIHGMKVNGYLTVESNLGLTLHTLEWVYRTLIPTTPGKKDDALKDLIKRFQSDFGLSPDGKVGWRTREKMTNLLLENGPFPQHSRHFELGTAINAITMDGLNARAGDWDEKYRGLIGNDDRKETYTLKTPYKWISLIQPRYSGHMNKSHHFEGSGVLISPEIILTCAHNIYSMIDDIDKTSKPLEAYQANIIPGYDGSKIKWDFPHPFDDYTVEKKNFKFLPGWPESVNGEISFNANFDIAVIKLPKKINLERARVGRRKDRKFVVLGSWLQAGNYEIAAMTPDELNGRKIYSAGYPGFQGSRQFRISGKVDNTPLNVLKQHFPDKNNNRIAYNMDTTPGQSGSPIWCKVKKVSRSGRVHYHNRMAGIVTKTDKKFNTGVALTEDTLRQIRDWYPKIFRFSKGRLTLRK